MSDWARGGGYAGALYAETLMAAWTAYSYNIQQRATIERVSFQIAERARTRRREEEERTLLTKWLVASISPSSLATSPLHPSKTSSLAFFLVKSTTPAGRSIRA
jgi:hypothetical protein